MSRSSTFPRRLFKWFLTQQIVMAAVAIVVLDLLILFWLSQKTDLSAQALETGQKVVVVSLLSTAIVMIGVSIFMARRLVIPLGRLIYKTQRIHQFPFEEDEPTGDLSFDEPGEWYDLERALNELARDLQHKTIRLSREKTELRTIMSGINEAVLAIDRERRPLFYNNQFALLFGIANVQTPDVALGDIVRSPEVLDAFSLSLSDGTVAQREARLDLGSGGVRHFMLSIAPLRKKHNQEIYGAVAVFHDVTEMKKIEDMRIEFVGNVSHELRTPLTSISGYLQTAIADLKRGDTSEVLSFLQVVGKNVERLMQLVNDLLDLSSLQSGVKLRTEKVDLEDLTQNVLGQVDVREHNVKVDLAVREISADEGRVEQVIRNLVQNAARYVPKGGRIEISTSLIPQGGVRLSVKDNGPGIAKELQPRLFERFFRVDEARSRQVGGSGIGLAIVKHIMLRSGGSVRVVSEPGHGAEFVCDFPN